MGRAGVPGIAKPVVGGKHAVGGAVSQHVVTEPVCECVAESEPESERQPQQAGVGPG
jgi:hypothetical protein